MKFEGQTVIVTGAAHGIGRAAALMFAAEGAEVVCADFDPEGAEATAAACREAGAKARAWFCDQRDPQSATAVVEGVMAESGRIDVLANVAGIFPFAAAAETSDALWSDVIATNLSGTFYLCRAVLPHMLAAGRGNIVNVSSGAAFRGMRGLAAYSASKAGVVGFSRCLALEAAPSVRVNVVAPGPTDTQAYGAALPAGSDPARVRAEVARSIALGRLGQPEEIAEGVLWLASDSSRFVTGQVIHVNGGRFMP